MTADPITGPMRSCAAADGTPEALHRDVTVLGPLGTPAGRAAGDAVIIDGDLDGTIIVLGHMEIPMTINGGLKPSQNSTSDTSRAPPLTNTLNADLTMKGGEHPRVVALSPAQGTPACPSAATETCE